MSKLEEMLKYVSDHNEFYKNKIKPQLGKNFDPDGVNCRGRGAKTSYSKSEILC